MHFVEIFQSIRIRIYQRILTWIDRIWDKIVR